jgi:hypothetical protein
MAVTNGIPPPDPIATEMAPPWYHVEGPVGGAEFEQDRDKLMRRHRMTTTRRNAIPNRHEIIMRGHG